MFRTSAHRSLTAGVALVVAGVLPGFLTASLAPRIRGDFAFGDSRLGLAVAVFYVVSAISSTPAGRLVERVGALRGMRIGLALTAVSCVAIAAFADSAAGLTALLMAAAVGNGVGRTGSRAALLKREVATHRQGLAFGAQQAGASIGSLLAGLALPAVAIPLGWRWAFLATAVLGARRRGARQRRRVRNRLVGARAAIAPARVRPRARAGRGARRAPPASASSPSWSPTPSTRASARPPPGCCWGASA